MADYWQVSPKVWAHARREKWDDDTRLLAVYLLTCQHRTTEGLFRLLKEYAAADLCWTTNRLEKSWSRLVREDFIDWDEPNDLVLIVNALGYQKPDNDNQIKHAIKALQALPPSRLLNRLYEQAKRFAEPFAEQLRERFGEAISTLISPSPNSISNSKPPEAPQGASRSEPTWQPTAERVMEHWNAAMTPTPWRQPKDLTPKRRRHIDARLRRYSEEQLCAAVDNLRASAWHCGDNDRGWVADPEFLFRSDEQVEKWLQPPSVPARASPPASVSEFDPFHALRQVGGVVP